MNKTLATRNEWVCSEISKGLDNPSTKSATKIQQGNPPLLLMLQQQTFYMNWVPFHRGFEGKVICPGGFCVVGAHPHLQFPSSVSTCTGSTHVHKTLTRAEYMRKTFPVLQPQGCFLFCSGREAWSRGRQGGCVLTLHVYSGSREWTENGAWL